MIYKHVCTTSNRRSINDEQHTKNKACVRTCVCVCVSARMCACVRTCVLARKAVIATEYKAARFLQMGKKEFSFFNVNFPPLFLT